MKSLLIIWLLAILAGITTVVYVNLTINSLIAHADTGQCAGYPNGICEFNPAITQWMQTYKPNLMNNTPVQQPTIENQTSDPTGYQGTFLGK